MTRRSTLIDARFAAAQQEQQANQSASLQAASAIIQQLAGNGAGA